MQLGKLNTPVIFNRTVETRQSVSRDLPATLVVADTIVPACRGASFAPEGFWVNATGGLVSTLPTLNIFPSSSLVTLAQRSRGPRHVARLGVFRRASTRRGGWPSCGRNCTHNVCLG
ncbi:hypothetical protein HRR83_005866 [Exophiala dermatitidis]|uniref:Uncharacterized protein n=1 Tax=Exophiala dermatitidis TaxID=5970 RepID=A0AAN6EMR8_EXODE|nr:hypothetical protein HRR73_007443 [Exophiala dermatitidis]KAJ4513421.1 hypothetical protein HRR74_006235 [Exophiala dermatitidis]KAJ4538023.1 hypothetical protein HRR77_007065 [Exophiala dermatitidis]KAJ4539754.1 hypothetical protein HRR76_003192 [Exophiala dermatitidis]KAJ4562314.1 hypothetical protein HRR79_006643 [Exophiala dermatitidis]